MGIKSKYNRKDIFKSFTEDSEKMKLKSIKMLSEVGKRVVDDAVAKGNYTDRTGTLRSSIGCGVSLGGSIKFTYGFSGSSQKGAAEGRSLLTEELKKSVRINDVKLVVVAGAKYASFVESNINYMVFDNAESFINENVRIMLKELGI